MRWDGAKLIDLADFDVIHVSFNHDTGFVLHGIPVEGSQPVSMHWYEKKKLTKDVDGTIRLKTADELAKEEKRIEKNRLVREVRSVAGDFGEQILDLIQIVRVIVAAENGDSDAKKFVSDIEPVLNEAYDLTEAIQYLTEKLPVVAGKIKDNATLARTVR